MIEDSDDYLHGEPRNPPDDPTATALDLLPAVLLERGVGSEGLRDIIRQPGLCVVVETHIPDLVRAVEVFLDDIADWDYTIVRTASKMPQPDDLSHRNAIVAVVEGKRIYGVATAFQLLPPAVLTAADLKVSLPKISAGIVADVIEKMTKIRPEVPSAVDRLSFDDIVGCLRIGATAEECIARLERTLARTRIVTPIPESAPRVEDLHGYGEAQRWALDLIEDLDAWRAGQIEFDSIDHAVVLASAPGLGKTTFVKSLARSTQLPLIETSVADWFANSPGYLDSVIKAIDEVFASARSAAPAILFLDECDAMVSRSMLTGQHASWWMPVITHLLMVLDGVISDPEDRLIVIGATNHPERLDPALVRPGRLNPIIHIGLPDAEALQGIFRQHLGSDLAREELSAAAGLAVGGTGADVVAWVRAARRTARACKRAMVMDDLLQAIAPADPRPQALLKRIAAHEAGHAVAAHLLGFGVVGYVSIVSHGEMGGVTSIDRDPHVPTRMDIETLVVQILAGRAAEEIIFGDPGTGAGGRVGSDLAIATKTLGLLHLGMGLGDDLIFRADAERVLSVLDLDRAAAAKVENDLRQLYQQALDLIRDNTDLVLAVADQLLTRRRLDGKAFLDAIEQCHSDRLPREIANG